MDVAQGQTTVFLLQRARDGDAAAREALFARVLPLLRRWAHGRLPTCARDLNETNDLVQVTLVRAMNRLASFQAEGTGAFLAYLRHILLNAVKDEVRRSRRRGLREALDDHPVADPSAGVVERLVGAEDLARYEAALAALPERQQQLLILRVEFGMSFPEIAAETGSSPDAVRMMVNRALAMLAAEIGHGQDGQAD
ncbi:MAG: sigma-70 family RNA polymerase sigma factor [Xanthomonadales bacterium]|nr:sigma-70 family RNA polymerase sigma factor [Xanthomonadales bacterium]